MSNYEFSEEIKKHKHISKVDENTWLVQSDPKSRCQAYFVTLSDNVIVMHGDYDGVIVNPSDYGKKNLVCWMRNATTLSYFAEKVSLGNRYHKTKDWKDDRAISALIDNIADREFEIKNYRGECSGEVSEEDIKIIKQIMIDCESAETWKDHKNFALYKYFDDDIRFDNQHEFIDCLREFSTDIGMEMDYEDYDIGEDYHRQLRWQHECLLWWADKVVDEVLENE